jgi:hypothetical protein
VASFGVSHLYLASLPQKRSPRSMPMALMWCLPAPSSRRSRGAGRGRLSRLGPLALGSGSTGAALIGVGIDDDPTAVRPAAHGSALPAAVKIVPNWDVIGLRGTGSHDLVVEDVFVPDEWTFVRGAPPTIDLPAYRYPPGAGRRCWRWWGWAWLAPRWTDGQMAGKRGSITGAPVMAERANVQIALAKGESQWQATRAWFYEVTERPMPSSRRATSPRASRWR